MQMGRDVELGEGEGWRGRTGHCVERGRGGRERRGGRLWSGRSVEGGVRTKDMAKAN